MRKAETFSRQTLDMDRLDKYWISGLVAHRLPMAHSRLIHCPIMAHSLPNESSFTSYPWLIHFQPMSHSCSKQAALQPALSKIPHSLL